MLYVIRVIGLIQGKYAMNERLKEVRLSTKKSQRVFAEHFGLAQQTYANYETGKSAVPDDFKKQLADMGINIHWLVTGYGQMRLTNNRNISSHYTISEPAYDYSPHVTLPEGNSPPLIIDPKMILIPIIYQKVSGGKGKEGDNDFLADDMIALPASVLKHFGRYKLRGVEIHGDSMQPVICNGDIVVIATKLISGNGIYALEVDEEVLVRRLEFNLFDDTLNIISENDKYESVLFQRRTNRIKILGKVVGRFMLYW